MERNKNYREITISKDGEIHQTIRQASQRAKVENIGGLNKAKKAVKARQKTEAVENKIAFSIDRKDKRQRERANKRKQKRVR